MPDQLLATTRHALLHRIATAQAHGRAPSVVGAVLRDGEPVWTASRSMLDDHAPDADTQYRIGSITKTFVAILVLRLRDEGRLDLNDPLERHLPGTPVGGLRIAELLAHTSGLASESAGPWWERTPGQADLADALGPEPMRLPPGRQFHYSNPGFGVLGALVAKLRGQPWGDVLQAEVLDPLGMSRTTLMPQAPHAGGWAVHPWADVLLREPADDARAMAPAGQLWSTAADLGRFASFLQSGNELVLGSDTLAEMRRPIGAGDDWNSGYGLGMQLLRRDERTLAGHTGSMPGFLATLWVSPEERLASVVLANVTHGVQIGALGADLIGIVAEREPSLPAPWRPLSTVDPSVLALVGPWYWGPAAYGMYLTTERGLELRPLGAFGRASRFVASADGMWVGLDGYYAGETLRAVRDETGAVTHLDLGTFIFTRAPYDPSAPVPGDVDPDGWRAAPS